MSEMIFQEVDFFTASFIWGVILLAAYDIVRIFRRTLPHTKGLVAAEDLAFWLISGIFVFRMMYEKNDGIIRGTAFLAMAAGMVLYHFFLSTYVVRLGYGLIGRPLQKIVSFFCRGLKKIQKAVKLLLEKNHESKKEEDYDKGTKKSTERSKKGN